MNMEDDFSGLLFSANNSRNKSCHTTFNISHQLSVSSIDEVNGNGIDTVTEANDLLENGILVETSKGLVCLSLKDALTSGIGGLNLSVEDLQNVAAQLLIAQNTTSSTKSVEAQSVTKGGIKVNVLPDVDLTQVYHKLTGNGSGNSQVELGAPKPVEVKIEISGKPHKPAPKVAKKANNFKQVSKIKKSEIITLLSPVGPNAHFAPETSPLPEPFDVELKTSTNQSKKRGGWPKGRKRKPEVTTVQAPKAPATGYVLYLNENRKQYKDLPFPEVTKLLGNLWSNLSLEEKKIYLDQADIEKKRYREELKAYRQSDAYQSYLNKKRIKKLQGNGTEESDMDATDEIEDEDNEELYCRTCDQWFSSLHNKKEHLYGRQHLQVIAGDFTKEHLAAEQQDGSGPSSYSLSTSLDESSLDGLPPTMPHETSRAKPDTAAAPANMTDAITRLMETSTERDREIKVLDRRLEEEKARNNRLNNELHQLREREMELYRDLEWEREAGALVEQELISLWTVPSQFCSNLQFEMENDETLDSKITLTVLDGS